MRPTCRGSGFSDTPGLDEYEYTFERLSHVIEAMLDDLGVERYVLFVTDFGTPVNYVMATRHTERVLGLVVQNGNVHEAGLNEAYGTRPASSGPSRPRRTRRPCRSG